MMKVHLSGTWGRGSYGGDCGIEALRAHLGGLWPDRELVLEREAGEPFSPTTQDAGILAGSGLLYSDLRDRFRPTLGRYLRFPAAMQLFDKPTFLLGLGVQGHLAADVVAPFAPTFERAKVFTVRDAGSAQRLVDAGVGARVLRSADLSYLVPRPAKLPGGSVARPVLGVAVSQCDADVIHTRFNGFERRVTEALEALSGDFDLRFFSFHTPDEWLPESWPRRAPHVAYSGSGSDGVRRFERLVSDVDLFLTSRFHGVTLAASMGIPFVGMGAADEKVARECESLRHPYFVGMEAPAGSIVEAVRRVREDRDDIHENLGRAAESQRLRARRSLDLLTGERPAAGDDQIRSMDEAWVSDTARRLVVWAGSDEFIPEANRSLDAAGGFDLLVSTHSAFDPVNAVTRLVSPTPGLIHWEAFPESLRTRLEGTYDSVVVFHTADRPRTELVDIARIVSRGRRNPHAWEFRLWTHELLKLDTAAVEERAA